MHRAGRLDTADTTGDPVVHRKRGGLEVIYQVDKQVDRFFIFTTGIVKQSDGTWAVETLSENDPGETIYACRPAQPSGTA